MKKFLSFVFLCFVFGCTSIAPIRNDYVEGTSVVIGLLVPVNGSLVGLQAFTYLSGKHFKSADTNLAI